MRVSIPPRTPGRRPAGNTAPVLHRGECLSGARASCPRTRRKARRARAPDDGARLRRERGRDALAPEAQLRIKNWCRHQRVTKFTPCEGPGGRASRPPTRRKARLSLSTGPRLSARARARCPRPHHGALCWISSLVSAASWGSSRPISLRLSHGFASAEESLCRAVRPQVAEAERDCREWRDGYGVIVLEGCDQHPLAASEFEGF